MLLLLLDTAANLCSLKASSNSHSTTTTKASQGKCWVGSVVWNPTVDQYKLNTETNIVRGSKVANLTYSLVSLSLETRPGVGVVTQMIAIYSEIYHNLISRTMAPPV